MKTMIGSQATWKASQRELRHNVRRNRINLSEAIELQAEQVDLQKLINSIRAETQPIIQREIEAFDRLNGRDHEKQGFVFDLSKYANIKTLRPCKQLNDLASENEAVGACFLSGMEKAENDSRSYQEK